MDKPLYMSVQKENLTFPDLLATLKMHMKAERITETKLAKTLDKRIATVHDFLNGVTTNPTLETMSLITAAVGFTLQFSLIPLEKTVPTEKKKVTKKKAAK